MKRYGWILLLIWLLGGACASAEGILPTASPTEQAPPTPEPTEAPPLLEYALPGADELYRGETWFAECSITGACTVRLAFYADEAMTDPVASIRKKLNGSGQFRVPWNGRADGRRVKPGRYWGRVHAEGQRANAAVFTLDVYDEQRPGIALAPTGPLLPDSLDDADVWRAMTAPLVVVDIEATAHQKLYAKPSGKSAVRGTVHGQSQGLEVLDVGERYTLVRAFRHEDGALTEGYVPTRRLKVVAPRTRYGLLIDKAAQTLTVYERGRPIGQTLVSTGLQAKDKLFRETRAGAFLVVGRVSPFESKGFRYEYAIRFDGGNLLHQVGWSDAAGFEPQLAQLGEKASEGCVRVDSREGAVNAYWLWTHIEYGTKVLVLDDENR